MLFGAHVSIAGGIENSPKRASELGCEVFQIFSRSPQSFSAPEISDKTAELFLENMQKYKQKEAYIHTPYIINLASTNNRIRYGSIKVIQEELKRASKLKVKYVMTHLGSYKDVDTELEGPLMVVDALKKVLDGDFSAQLLLEISAGAGNIVGCRFEELAYFLEELSGYSVGVCLDTAHMFASGYDIRTKESFKKVFDEFDKIVGIKHLKLFHLNDSKVELGAKKDRHEHIGDGYIGKEAFLSLVQDERLKNINGILETQHDKVKKDISIMKGFRDLQK